MVSETRTIAAGASPPEPDLRRAWTPLSIDQWLRSAEDGQARLAADLHDGLTQYLTSALGQLHAAQHALANGDADRVQDALAAAIDLVRTSITEARNAIDGLRPPGLDDRALGTALRQLAEQTLPAGTRQRCLCDDVTLSDEDGTQVYRFVQEALTNVRRHADARQVELVLRESADGVHVLIRDDGRGFRPGATGRDPSGFGLLAMRLRTAALGGQLSLESAPGAGTTIQLHIPLP